MTNAEAIETLKANYPDACYEQLREAVDAAIEALKAQDTAGDTIYRQVAIDAVQGIGRLATLQDNDAVVRMSAVEYVLFNLPSAQTEQRWIPCSERLPNKEGNYLITAQPTYNHTKDIRIAHWSGRWVGYVRFEILAWMPLPEPYKGCDKDAD